MKGLSGCHIPNAAYRENYEATFGRKEQVMTVAEAVAWADDVIDREDSAEWYGAGEYLSSRYEDLMDRA